MGEADVVEIVARQVTEHDRTGRTLVDPVERPQEVGRDRHVRIEEGEGLVARGFHATLPGDTRAKSPLDPRILDETNVVACAFEARPQRFVGAVVDYHHLERIAG